MQLFQPNQSPGLGTLIKVFTVLGILLIVLAVVSLLGDILGLLDRFRSELYLFLLGALLAYLIAPAVRLLQRVVRKPWAAVLGAYLTLFLVVLAFGALLLTPFITQAQSLVKNLQSPTTTSLVRLQDVQRDLHTIQADLSGQQQQLLAGRPIPSQQVQQTQTEIARLVGEVSRLATTTTQSGAAQIPPSYAAPIAAPVSQLQAAYALLTTTLDTERLARAVAAANEAARQTTLAYQKTSSTPLLLLDLQTVLDQHGVVVDLHDRFSQVLQGVNDQVSLLLNNALNFSLRAGNALLDIVLIFIISIYFVRDGGRLIAWLVHLAPAASRPQVKNAVTSLDQILGSYIRTQFLLALLAGLSDSLGAVVLGIPYPVVIFVSSFLLSLVPVLGPVVLPVPPLGIALIFTPLPKPILFLIWLLIGEQIVTNVVGPRLQAYNLRIHPLEAMAAALAGLPLAGLAGAFFSVPVVAFCHIVIREFVNARRSMLATPDDTTTNERRSAAS